MGPFNVIDRLVDPITKKIFPPEENWFEAPNYVEFQRRRYNSALTGVSFIFKAIAVCFVIYWTIVFFSTENKAIEKTIIEPPTLYETFTNLHSFSEQDKFWAKLSVSERAELRSILEK